MSITHPLAEYARHPGERNIFADVIGVDACGAPILAPGAQPVPCENEAAGTTAEVLGMGRMTVAQAEREVTAGRLVHVAGHTFRPVTAKLDADAEQMLRAAAARRAARAQADQDRYRAKRDAPKVTVPS